jgi:hypothetical protein
LIHPNIPFSCPPIFLPSPRLNDKKRTEARS